MTPIQQLFLGVGASEKTYVDDVFSTYVYRGNESARAINNGIDLSGKGGLVWGKARNDNHDHHLVDTVRGANKILESNSNDAEATVSNRITGFNSNGFNLGSAGQVNGTNAYKYSSWSFRKAKGFFDVVTWDGNGTAGRVISHGLGSVPGLIMIKSTTHATSWFTYHGSLGASSYVMLNENNAEATSQSWFMNNTDPTSTGFSVGGSNNVNGSGRSYVAYVFAGVSDNSVAFDKTDDFLTTGQGNMWTFGTNDFTVECWVKFDSTSGDCGIYQAGGTGTGLKTQNYGQTPAVGHNGSNWIVYGGGGTNTGSGGGGRNANQWYHVAHVRNSGTTKLYVDGVEKISFSDTYSYGVNRACIGGYYNTSYLLKGKITNFRLVKGRALYTSNNFTPPSSSLGLTTDGDGNVDTMLLCCNTGSPTGFTKDDSGNGMTSNGDPQQSSDVPFTADSTLFGDNEDQSIIRCGSYTGNGSSTGPKIDLGWEPQYLLLKNADEEEQWQLFDSMRGIPTGGNDEKLMPSIASSASTAADIIDLMPTGFKLKTSDTDYNGNNDEIIYIAIRRPDGYVGKPAEAGTDVLTMATGNSNAYRGFTSGFPVDWAFYKKPASTSAYWYPHSRLTGKQYTNFSTTGAEQTNAWGVWDDNAGWAENTYYDSSLQSWMFKRHAGFDVVTYKGYDPSGVRNIQHSMNAVPEMIILKKRDDTGAWCVGHKGLNGGTNPWSYIIQLESDAVEQQHTNAFASTAPTSTVFTVGPDNAGNGTYDYLAMLFASIPNISAVGSYTGDGTSNGSKEINLGFTPRFVLLKSASVQTDWWVFDTLRGLPTSGNATFLKLNQTSDQSSSIPTINATSTGFKLMANYNAINASGSKIIYYAHA